MTTDDIKKHLCVLKPELILSEDAKEMFCLILSNIDFKVCETDMEMLQLFFKRVYAGIDELRKHNAILKKEIEELKPSSPELEVIEISPLESLIISENLLKN